MRADSHHRNVGTPQGVVEAVVARMTHKPTDTGAAQRLGSRLVGTLETQSRRLHASCWFPLGTILTVACIPHEAAAPCPPCQLHTALQPGPAGSRKRFSAKLSLASPKRKRQPFQFTTEQTTCCLGRRFLLSGEEGGSSGLGCLGWATATLRLDSGQAVLDKAEEPCRARL